MMDSVGYSKKILVEKLGYKPGETVALMNAPQWFKVYLDSFAITPSVKPPAHWGHAFFTIQSELELFCEETDLSLIEKGLWVSWPKKSSGVETNLTEQMFRDYILPLRWVDTKICAIDDTWSGLKFLRRKSRLNDGLRL